MATFPTTSRRKYTFYVWSPVQPTSKMQRYCCRACSEAWKRLFTNLSHSTKLMTGGGQAQSRSWCFTLNNYTQDDEQRIGTYTEEREADYVVYGREVGESGTPHLQGFILFAAKKRLSGVKELFLPAKPHLERMRGTKQQAIAYCKKDGDIYEAGSIGDSDGCPDSLLGVREAIRNGESLSRIVGEHFGVYLRYRSGIERAIQLSIPVRDFVTEVRWYWGLPGTGKSHRSFAEATEIGGGSGTVHFAADVSCKWFNGYDPSEHKTVIFDDFDGSATFSLLLRLFDRYPCQVPTKGGFVQWRPEVVFISSNFSPRDLYGQERNFDALLRRLTVVEQMNNVYVPPVNEEVKEQSE